MLLRRTSDQHVVRKIMTKYCLVVLIFVIMVGTGCSRKAKSSERAAKFASEASVLMSKSDFEGARSKYVLASEMRPDCAEYHVGAAMCAVKLEDYTLAREEYGKAKNILKLSYRYV